MLYVCRTRISFRVLVEVLLVVVLRIIKWTSRLNSGNNLLALWIKVLLLDFSCHLFRNGLLLWRMEPNDGTVFCKQIDGLIDTFAPVKCIRLTSSGIRTLLVHRSRVMRAIEVLCGLGKHQ